MTQIIQLNLKLSNAFLLLGKKMVLLDTGTSNETSTIIRTFQKAGLNLQDLSLIVHTHAHFDHCGSTADLQQKSGALVAIHKSDAPFFLEGKSVHIEPINLFGKLIIPFMKDGYQTTKIDLLMDDEFDLHPFGIDGKVIATPGHTPGSISILLDSGEIIAGDLIGGGRLMGILQPGRPRYHHWYSDFDLAKKSIARIMEMNPTRIFVGHGGPLEGKDAIRYFNRER
ncbi:MAG: MBL fold metallo-hydrolase [Desulfobacula sp.]|jgi:hydroxyacylglutathione hydrolase|nr:MBL fold metallo-hydrolase [Desulfobacula sp.]